MAIGRQILLPLRHCVRFLKGAVSWWRRHDRQYRWRWRAGNLLAACLLVAAIVLPVMQSIRQDRAYLLSSDAQKLVGTVDPSLKKQLTYDAAHAEYQFNKEGEATDTSLPPQLQKATAGTPKGKDSATYSVDVPVDMKKGVTYHDTNSQLSFSLTPDFTAMAGREVDGHLVYPLQDDNQAIYTLKNNGLKEDIVVPKATADTLTFSYTLNIPKTLVAKVIPGSGGAIGLYSADPALFGDISFGSDSDRQAVEKARENADKTTLVFGLPAPKLDTADGSPLGNASARFDLTGNKLSVIATGLKDLHVPVTIDPSVVVTSTSDFQTNGNNEGMISFGTGVVGQPAGSAGAWGTTSSFATARDMDTQTVVYNGYMYVMGGYSYSAGTEENDVQYAPINANGTLGTWSSTTNLPGKRDGQGTFAANGYMYIVGGSTNGNYFATTYSIPINANGTLGSSWTQQTSFSNARAYMALMQSNGYVYIVGGYAYTTTDVYYSDVQYAKINSGGGLGSWAAGNTTGLSTSLLGENIAGAANNGYVYIFGGKNGGGVTNLSQYAQVNPADGTLGTWTVTTSMPDFRDGQGAAVYNGYIYITGGNNASWFQNTVWYAPLNANGSIGAWQTTSSFSTPRDYVASAAYNGYLYLLGGRDDKNNNYSDVQYALLAASQTTGAGNQVQRDSVSGGSLGAWGETSAFATPRYNNETFAYNNYIYIVGGYDGTNAFNDVQYAPINSDGTIGTWSSTSSMTTKRERFGGAIYNGYMYAFGGYTDTGSTDTATVEYAPVNTNGTLGTWKATSSLPYNAGEFGSAVYNGYLYVTAGYTNATGYRSSVAYAPLNGDGTVGTWQTTTALPGNRADDASVAYNGYLYVMGGYLSGTYMSDVLYAPINSNGTVGSWTSTSAMTTVRRYAAATIYDGYIYAVGGQTSSTTLSSSEYAQVNANGTIGTWQTTSNQTFSRQSTSVAAYNGFMYSAGGYGGDGTHSSGAGVAASHVMYTRIDPDGMTGAFANTSAAPAARAMPCAVTYNGTIYELGGNTSDGSTNNVTTVYKATINADGTLGTWASTGATNLPEARSNFGCAVANGYIYIAGGYTGSGTAISTVRYVPINSDGTLGTWVTSAPSLPHTTIGRTLVSATAGNGSYLYSVGGLNSVSSTDATGVYYASLNASTGAVGSWTTTSSLIDNYAASSVTVLGTHIYAMGGAVPGQYAPNTPVEYTTISSTGSLATWQATTALPSPVAFGDATTVDGCIYDIGGQSSTNGTPVQPNVFACPNADGTITQWYFSPKLNWVATDLAATSYGGYIYALGGNDSSSNTANVRYGQVNSGGNGSVGSWNTANSFTTARDSFGSVAYNGYLYVLGGEDSTSDHNDVQYAPITATGALGTWASTTSFTNIRYGLVAAAYNGYMYVLAGAHGSTNYNDVQYAQINANGTLESSWHTTTSFTGARQKPAVAVYNGYMYISGGWNGTSDYNDVQYAQINANGTLESSWHTTTSFTTGRNRHKMIAYNGYMYIIGGWDNGDLGDVQYAPINSGGTLGTWQVTTGFRIAREASGVAVYNGNLYLTGGYSSSLNASYNDVQYAPINSDGTLGQWNTTQSFATNRNSHGTVAYNGYLYVFGGSDSSEFSDVQYAQVNQAALIGHYSKLIDLGSTAGVTSITYNGVLPGGTGAIAYKGAGANGVFTLSGTASGITSSGACTSSLSGVRYLEVLITLDDSGAQPGGVASGASTSAYLTDFTVNYKRTHPAPNVRLHLGKTLQQGSGQSPLDTCYP